MKSVIHAIAFAPDGKSLFVGDDFGTITQLEAKTLLRLKRWVAHKRSVYALAVARNGQYMISGSLDGQVKAWSGTGFKLIRTWRNKGPVFTVDISPDNKLIATANGDRHVRVWDWKKQIEVFSFRDTGMVHTVAFSPDGTKLASGSPNNCLYLWDLSARPNHLSFSLQSP